MKHEIGTSRPHSQPSLVDMFETKTIYAIAQNSKGQKDIVQHNISDW